MVGRRSAGERGAPLETVDGVTAREARGLARCARALERRRRVRGRVRVSGDHGLLVDLRGALGHVPATEVAHGPPRSAWSRAADWEGWVEAVGEDLVHLTTRRTREWGDNGAPREGEVVSVGRSGVRVRLADGGLMAVVPWDELSWQPMLERPRLEPGDRVAGRVTDLTLEGPVLSPRAVTPSPWPAVALALPPGSEVDARVDAIARGQALLRTLRSPRGGAVVDASTLPAGAGPGATVRAVVAAVDVVGGGLALERLELSEGRSSRAPRRAPGAETPEPPGPGTAASGSRS